MRMILASGSGVRATMLRAAGYDPDIVPAAIDERAVTAADPVALALALATVKAASVAADHPDALVIGADQVLIAPDGSVMHKAADPAVAEAQIATLAGQTHRLVSAAAIVAGNESRWTGHQVATIALRPLSPGEIRAYVGAQWDRIRHCVGGYEIEGAGVQLFAQVDGDVWTVQGLPLLPLLAALRTQGVGVRS